MDLSKAISHTCHVRVSHLLMSFLYIGYMLIEEIPNDGDMGLCRSRCRISRQTHGLCYILYSHVTFRPTKLTMLCPFPHTHTYTAGSIRLGASTLQVHQLNLKHSWAFPSLSAALLDMMSCARQHQQWLCRANTCLVFV